METRRWVDGELAETNLEEIERDDMYRLNRVRLVISRVTVSIHTSKYRHFSDIHLENKSNINVFSS